MQLRKGVCGLQRVTSDTSDKPQYVMDGVKVVRQRNGQVRAEATTGYSTVVAWFDQPGPRDKEFQDVIIPTKLCKQIASLSTPLTVKAKRANASQPVELTAVDGVVSITVKQDRDSACFTAPGLDGRFPRIVDVWPDLKGSVSIRIDALLLVPILGAMAELVTDEDGRAPVTLTLSGNGEGGLLLTAVANGYHVGAVLCDLVPDDEKSKVRTMQFNPKTMYRKKKPTS